MALRSLRGDYNTLGHLPVPEMNVKGQRQTRRTCVHRTGPCVVHVMLGTVHGISRVTGTRAGSPHSHAALSRYGTTLRLYTYCTAASVRRCT